MRSMELQGIVSEGGFEARTTVSILLRGLFYLPCKIGKTEVSLLLDSGATNSFVSPEMVRRLGLTEKAAKDVTISFAQGAGGQAV